MCCMCRVRFLCSAYRLVHHGSARHPCARGPGRDVVLAPLSITLRLPKPHARHAGGGMCSSRRSPFPPLCLSDGGANKQSHLSIEWCFSSMCFCIWGLHPCMTSVGLPLCLDAAEDPECSEMTGGGQVIMVQTAGKTGLA